MRAFALTIKSSSGGGLKFAKNKLFDICLSKFKTTLWLTFQKWKLLLTSCIWAMDLQDAKNTIEKGGLRPCKSIDLK